MPESTVTQQFADWLGLATQTGYAAVGIADTIKTNQVTSSPEFLNAQREADLRAQRARERVLYIVLGIVGVVALTVVFVAIRRR
jgi:hypothetical protein